ncbi:acyltransferase [Spirosoma rhododendri]|uniref:Acyltransferase n=1 Tax=Spirosoma rhododendri TaxID=2728024 RepID=A0A7L5DFT4_9BACT|nr:acyltransferase [Spirosoma rhododendri]QJD77016.1 acyltransferase [Spirosoma rhododendri]
MNLSDYVKGNAGLKKLVHYLLVPAGQARPRRWVSWLINPWVHQRGRGARICRSARMDVLPFQPFQLGAQATIEDYCVINNGVGPVRVGDYSRVGIGSVVIGPVTIGNQVIIAQHVVVSGLNHVYTDVHKPIRQQPTTSRPVLIEDECWIGANVVITGGVRIGKHAVVAAGSVVTKDVPAYSVVAGNPARLLKQYDADSEQWLRVAPETVNQHSLTL